MLYYPSSLNTGIGLESGVHKGDQNQPSTEVLLSHLQYEFSEETWDPFFLGFFFWDYFFNCEELLLDCRLKNY